MTAAPFARPFRLVQRHGPALDGAEFPNGRVVLMDDPDWGLCSGARSLDLLLRHGYPDARIEWADQPAADAQPDADNVPAGPVP
ncbi:hypothetical protein [Streptomyces anulatus]|uniref:Uncharacterized protein n=1 Tax=Streptomyces anulatus TaxID=1892 RepID=A0ABZ1ZIG6_STRAQ|nr:hypothetical protein [Streptomyces anulatus]